MPDGFGRPTEPSHPRGLDLGRRLRGLTGVDEDLLEIIWHERSRHTALGAVMLGTSAIAAFSMWNFVNEALGRPSWVALLPALLWGVFVLHLDRWLVAPQPLLRRRVAPVVTRILVSLLIGAVVAEPLVLRIFETSIVEQVESQRYAALHTLSSDLVRCNPAPGQVVAGCGELTLSIDANAPTQQSELAEVQQSASALRQQVNQEQNRLDTINGQVLSECAKEIPIAGTGTWTRSSECVRLRSVAQAYSGDHDIQQDSSRLSAMNRTISSLEGSVADSRSDFLATRTALINKQVAQLRSTQGSIGVLDRMSALDRLAGGNVVLFVGVWLIRLLFVVIDVLPVLVKFLSGETTYERLLTERSSSAVLIFKELLRTDERKAMARMEVERADAEQRTRERKAEFDAARREHVAAMNIRVSQAVNKLEAELTRVGSVG
ncbi:DUF4407 domain-containing protein [Streptacidiphilus sp. P02-A3a]|nr:DUF4407 domain-containing protein [Streptacidiphilus sp. P02-A3a]